LSYSTFFGGNGDDGIFDIAVNSKGYAYVAGVSGSSDFPVKSGMDMTYRYSTSTGSEYHDLSAKVLPAAFGDGFVAKFAADGRSLVYCTYIGGQSADGVDAIAIDSNGNVALTGATASTDFPVTAGSYNTLIAMANSMFVAKLNAQGTGLLYSTFGQDQTMLNLSLEGNGIAIDSTGKIIVTGQVFPRRSITVGVEPLRGLPTREREGRTAHSPAPV